MLMLALWKTLPLTHLANTFKLGVYLLALACAGAAASLGLLPRTRPIIPGQLAVAD
jgi:hypothetical protein